MKPKTEKCKHEYGWIVKDRVWIFIDNNNELRINFAYTPKWKNRVMMRCNNPDCNAERTVRICGRAIGFTQKKQVSKLGIDYTYTPKVSE